MTDSPTRDHELVVIAPLTSMATGDRFDHGMVPLHLTTLPKVRVPPEKLPAVLSSIGDIASVATPITVTAAAIDQFGHIDQFGQGASVRVTTVELSDPLRQLHLHLLQRVHRRVPLPSDRATTVTDTDRTSRTPMTDATSFPALRPT